MPLHHAAPAPSFAAALPQGAPLASAPAKGAASFATALLQASVPAPRAAAPAPTTATLARQGLTGQAPPNQTAPGKDKAAPPARSTRHPSGAAAGAAQSSAQLAVLAAAMPVANGLLALPADGIVRAPVDKGPAAASLHAAADERAPSSLVLPEAADGPPSGAAPAAGMAPVQAGAGSAADAAQAGARATPQGAPASLESGTAQTQAAALSAMTPAGARVMITSRRPTPAIPSAALGTHIQAAQAVMEAAPAPRAAASSIPPEKAGAEADAGNGGGNGGGNDGGGAAGEPAPPPGGAEKAPGTTAKQESGSQARRADAGKTAAMDKPDGAAGQPNALPVAAAASHAAAEATAAPPVAGAIQGAGPAASTGAAAPQAGRGTAAAGGTAPAVQVAQNLSALHLAGAGARQVTIQLTPGSLGTVQVHVARAADGTATITLQAEKAETLHALQQDSAHLHEALDRAGVPSAGRQVSYELARGQADAGSGGAAGFGPGFGSGFGPGGGGGQGTGSHGQRGAAAGHPAGTGYAGGEPDAPIGARPAPPRPRAIAASGINITA